jgi:hypothetical protein
MYQRNGCALVIVIAVFAICGQAMAVSVDFNTPGDLAANFIQSPTSANAYSETNGIGVGGSRALDVAIFGVNDSGVDTSVHNGASHFSSVGDHLTTSLYVLSGSFNTGLPTLELGFLGNTDQTLSSSDTTARYLAVKFTRFSSKLEIDKKATTGGSTITGPFTGTIIDGHWYKLSVDLVNLGSENVQLTASLDDYGTSGMASPTTAISISPTVVSSIPALTGDATVFAGFLGHTSGGADAFDNFSLLVPEPGSLLCLLLAIPSLTNRGINRRRLRRV